MAIRKRASSTGSAGGAKRQRSVLKQCNSVKQAVLGAEGIPAKVLKMVTNNIPDCLGVPAEDRDSYQKKVIEMIGEALSIVETRMTASISDMENKHGSANTEKESRDRALEEATTAVTDKTTALEAATASAVEAKTAAKAQEDAVAEAEEAQRVGDAELEKAEADKRKLDGVLNMNFVPLKEGAIAGKAAKQCMKELQSFAKKSVMDAGMVEALPAALSKAPGERGSFDGMVLQNLEEELRKKIKDLEEVSTTGEPGKNERAEKVTAAKAALDSARANEATCIEKEVAAKGELSEAKVAQKAAKQAVSQFSSDMKEVEKALAAAKAELETFRSGAAAAYKDLLVYSAIAAAPAAAEGQQAA